MLGKLMKYELRATAGSILPIYGSLLVLAGLWRLSLAGYDAYGNGSEALEIAVSLLTAFYMVVMVSSFVVTAVVMIRRFYTNLTGSEGYLMFTLPTGAGSVIFSKFAVSSLWWLVNGAAVLLSGLILLTGAGSIEEIFTGIWEAMRQFFYISGIDVAEFSRQAALIGLALLAGGARGIMQVYAAIALGHTFRRRKVAGAVLAYFGLNIAVQILSVPIAYFYGDYTDYGGIGLQALSGGTLAAAALNAGLALLFFFITRYIFTKHINLE